MVQDWLIFKQEKIIQYKTVAPRAIVNNIHITVL